MDGLISALLCVLWITCLLGLLPLFLLEILWEKVCNSIFRHLFLFSGTLAKLFVTEVKSRMFLRRSFWGESCGRHTGPKCQCCNKIYYLNLLRPASFLSFEHNKWIFNIPHISWIQNLFVNKYYSCFSYSASLNSISYKTMYMYTAYIPKERGLFCTFAFIYVCMTSN